MSIFRAKAGSTAEIMQAVTPSPSSPTVDWEAIRSHWPEIEALYACPQDPIHHAEGDAGTHTRMVVEALVSDPNWQALDAKARKRLFWTAVFHDVGKPATTVHETDGRITSAGHSRAGASMFRLMAWEAGLPMTDREAVCSLIMAHQAPFWLYERSGAHKAACRMSLSLKPSELVLHAKADALGRICADQRDLLDRIQLSTMIFEEIGALDGTFQFANDESRYAYFEKEDRDPFYAAHEDFRCEATLVCGLPGTGKDTWIANNMPDVPIVSLDRVREGLGVGPLDNQGRVIQEGFEQARVQLRASRDFVWNATNVTRNNREKIVRLLRDYNARIRIVYLEVAPDALLAQNNARKATVPVDAIVRLAQKMEPPHADEGHEIEWIRDGHVVFQAGHPSFSLDPSRTPATR